MAESLQLTFQNRFYICQTWIGLLSDREPKRLIFVKESQERASKLIESDVEKVVTAWAEGKFVVPVWLDVIYGRSRKVELKR